MLSSLWHVAGCSSSSPLLELAATATEVGLGVAPTPMPTTPSCWQNWSIVSRSASSGDKSKHSSFSRTVSSKRSWDGRVASDIFVVGCCLLFVLCGLLCGCGVACLVAKSFPFPPF